jgi:excisionase family DNA binding protein
MAKKYLSLDEAAHLLRVEPIELQRMRERGEIRGFQDRGNWRFREDEVQELLRTREDSNPDVPIQWDEQSGIDESIFFDSDSDVKLAGDSPKDPAASDSDVRLVFDETLGGPGSSGEVSIPSLGDSDSDVRLDSGTAGGKNKLDQTWNSEGSDSEIRLDLGDDQSKLGSDSDVQLVSSDRKPDSDSDVKLIQQQGAAEQDDSDSDVKLTEQPQDDLGFSDSDVKLVQEKTDQADVLGDSDSDVKMVGELFDSDSDSDVKLTGSLADFDIGGEKSDDALAATSASESIEVDLTGLDESSNSDVSLVDDKEYDLLDLDAPTDWTKDQKVPFESVESTAQSDDEPIGVVDSGISLAGDDDDSGIALDLGDSGIALDMGGESGISLDIGDDSGISLAGPADSGIALESADEGGSGFRQTIPQMNSYNDKEEFDSGGTHVEVPLLGADDQDEYALASDHDDTADSVPLLDEDDLAAINAPRGKKSPAATDGDLAVSIYDVEPSEEYAAELSDDSFGGEVSGEVFDAGEDVFQEGLQTGSSSAEFDMPVSRKAAPVEAEWGAAVNTGLIFSTALLALSGWVMFDLVRTMWAPDEPSFLTGFLLNSLKGLFGQS